MLAQWKSDGSITCKYLDQNEDMYNFFWQRGYIVLRKDRSLVGSSDLYQSILAQWKSDGFITRKCLDFLETRTCMIFLVSCFLSQAGRIELFLGSSISSNIKAC